MILSYSPNSFCYVANECRQISVNIGPHFSFVGEYNPFLVKLDCNCKNLKTNEIRIYFLTFWDSGSSSCCCSCICNIDEEENTLARFLPLVIDHNPSKS